MINSLLHEYIPSILDPSHRQHMSTRWGHWGHSEPRHHAHVVDQTGQIQPARHCSIQSLLRTKLQTLIQKSLHIYIIIYIYIYTHDLIYIYTHMAMYIYIYTHDLIHVYAFIRVQVDMDGCKGHKYTGCWCQPLRAAYSVGMRDVVTWPLNMAMETVG